MKHASKMVTLRRHYVQLSFELHGPVPKTPNARQIRLVQARLMSFQVLLHI